MYSELFFPLYFSIFHLWKRLSSFVHAINYCVGAGITTLMSISNGSDPYFVRRKMENAVREGRNGRRNVYFLPESACFPL